MTNNAVEKCESKYLPEKDLFRIDEAASYFGVSTRCIYLWIAHGILIAKQPKENGVMRVTRESILNCRLKKPQPA